MSQARYLSGLLVLYIVPDLVTMVTINKGNGSCVQTEQSYHDFDTPCTSCHINVFTDCPDGSKKLVKLRGAPNCTYEQSFGIGPNVTKDGCYHTCRQEVNETSCCPGYWGSHCDQCPGYSEDNICNGHGNCSDGRHGTGICSCFELWTGYSCESCTNSSLLYPNCTDPIEPMCNMTCPNNSRCAVISGESTCMCDWPYVDHSDEEGSFSCKEVDLCAIPPLCHTNASCTPDLVIGEKNCTCNPDYHGDGFDCDVTDPCQSDNGGCDPVSTLCVLLSPGKNTCECKHGYFEYVPDHGCSLIDVCEQNACHKRAKCTTVSPFTIRCTCLDGYVGDGHNCTGNILQTLKDLNTDDPDVQGQLQLIYTAMDTFFRKELMESSPITVFVSIDTGFKLDKKYVDFKKWLSNEYEVKSLLRQHILVGDFQLEYLLNQTTFYTLDGASAELILTNARRNLLDFRISGYRRQARILKGDIIASNGVIHITKKLLVESIGEIGNNQMTADQYISSRHSYSTFDQLIKLVSDRVKLSLQQPGITVLAPPNEAWDKLPWDSVEFLLKPENRDNVEVIVMNHILNNTYEVTDFFNVRRLMTAAGYVMSIAVDNGRFSLNEDVHITKADIVVKNGLLMKIDAVLLPDGISTLPNFCNEISYDVIEGPCGDCRDDPQCLYIDVKTNVTEACEYYAKNADDQYEKMSGCAPMCNRTFTTPYCCEGFYGLDCLPCPGGYRNPCHGYGVCDQNSGECSCNPNFSGVDCLECENENHFGPNCTQECTCVKGNCNNGPHGDGTCRSCFRDGHLLRIVGENCDQYYSPCGRRQGAHIHCHIHGMCIEISKNNRRCICEQGYTGDGETSCTEIDPCVTPEYGGCHQQATCIRTGPGSNNCTCNLGWTGDGTYCYRASSCQDHANCHDNAACVETFPGNHVCRCHDGYHGDGITWCVYDDRCAVDNGGCHPKALCTNTDPGRVNCTCLVDEGYSGNGFICHGNIVRTIMDNKNLTWIANILSTFTKIDMGLLLDNNYTAFAPHDDAVQAFAAAHVQNKTFGHWMKKDVLMSLLKYHTLLYGTPLDKLVILSRFTRLQTMKDGYYLHIERLENETVKINSMVGGPAATVLQSDIITTNGYLNIIDKILLPSLPTNPEDYPDLETFFKLHPEYSIFGDWLMKKNLTTRLEKSFSEYTLFIPNNDAMKHVKHTITTDYLLYHVVNMKIMLASYGNGTLSTALGAGHQLDLVVYNWFNVTINRVPIKDQDMYTLRGLVNGLTGLLHPVLHRCREIRQTVQYGSCEACADSYPCDRGFDRYLPDNGSIMACKYERFDLGFLGKSIELDGCQGLCYKNRTRGGCCAGYYGINCAECPGGPEFPCNGHGQCQDGNRGTGLCVCNAGFAGYNCDSCASGWTGDTCETDMMSCAYNNGGCDEDAICTMVADSKIHCQCREGLHGDGYNCTGPCDTQNGGCHGRAKCFFQASTGVTCTCTPPFVGDGKMSCNADLYSTLMLLDDVSMFIKSIKQYADESLIADLKNSSMAVTYSLLIPVDSSLPNPIPSKRQFLQQIVQGNISLLLKHGEFSRQTVINMAGDHLIVTFNSDNNVFTVNDTYVVKGNIPCTNGIIHLMSGPFTAVTLADTRTSTGGDGTTIGVSVAAAVLFVSLAICGVIMVMRKSQKSYWKTLQQWKSKQRTESTSQEEALHSDGEIKDPTQNDTTFGNPLYLVQNFE